MYMANSKGKEMTKESINGIFDGMSELLVKKNQDYKGASFDLGINGNMVHLWDKVSRYRNMVENKMSGGQPNFESIDVERHYRICSDWAPYLESRRKRKGVNR